MTPLTDMVYDVILDKRCTTVNNHVFVSEKRKIVTDDGPFMFIILWNTHKTSLSWILFQVVTARVINEAHSAL